MEPLHPNPLINLAAAIMTLWIMGLGTAVMIARARGAQKYVRWSVRVLRYILSSIVQMCADALSHIAKRVKG